MENETETTETKYRFRLDIRGIELATEHRYTMEQVEDIHRLIKNVTLIAVGNSDDVRFGELKQVIR